MCRAVLGTEGHRLLLRREDIYEFRFSPFLRAAWNFLRVKLELGVELYRRLYPEAEILLIEPTPMDSTLFL